MILQYLQGWHNEAWCTASNGELLLFTVRVMMTELGGGGGEAGTYRGDTMILKYLQGWHNDPPILTGVTQWSSNT